MFMLCYYYCIPFAKFLYFAAGPFFLLFSFFMLKRSLYAGRRNLRQWAFGVMFAAIVKITLFDIRMLKDDVVCGRDRALHDLACNKTGLIAIDLAGMLLLVLGCYLVLNGYRKYLNHRRLKPKTPEQVRLRFWANAAMLSVMVMVLWQIAPWAGYLTIGRVPALLDAVPWQVTAWACLAMIMTGFWKAESCIWVRGENRHRKTAHLNQTWTARDTLWLTVFIYLVTLGMGYVSHDVLAK